MKDNKMGTGLFLADTGVISYNSNQQISLMEESDNNKDNNGK
jgi:hypothetical protein